MQSLCGILLKPLNFILHFRKSNSGERFSWDFNMVFALPHEKGHLEQIYCWNAVASSSTAVHVMVWEKPLIAMICLTNVC